MRFRIYRSFAAFAVCIGSIALSAQTAQTNPSIDLPSSKQLIGEVPGHPQRINSLPISMAVSPDGRYVVTVNAGYGTFESKYDQSFAVLDTETGTLADFPDLRTLPRFASDALLRPRVQPRRQPFLRKHGFAHRCQRGRQGRCGQRHRGLQFSAGKIAPERLIRLPVAATPDGAKDATARGNRAIMKVYRTRPRLRSSARPVTRNCSLPRISPTMLCLLDAATGAIEKRFDLSESDAVPSTYPVALAATSDGKRAFVALWNASEIVELDLARGIVGRKLASAQAAKPRCAGNASMCDRFFARREDALRRARQSRRCCGRECRRGPISDQRATSTRACRGRAILAQSRLPWR